MKTAVLCSLSLLFLAVSTTPVFSQTFGITASGLYAFEFSGDLDSEKLNPKDSFGGGLVLVCAVSPFLKLDLGVDYLKADIKDTGGAEIEFLPVTLAVRAGPTFDPVFLYGGLGIGYSYNDYSGGTSEFYVTLKDSVIYFACLGAEINLTKNFIIRPEVRYNWLKPDLKYDNLDPFHGGPASYQEKWELDHLQFRLGAGVYF